MLEDKPPNVAQICMKAERHANPKHAQGSRSLQHCRSAERELTAIGLLSLTAA
jgi:hypothetical protein